MQMRGEHRLPGRHHNVHARHYIQHTCGFNVHLFACIFYLGLHAQATKVHAFWAGAVVLLKRMMKLGAHTTFNFPVDEEKDRARGYYSLISDPQNLGTILQIADAGLFTSIGNLNARVTQVMMGNIPHIIRFPPVKGWYGACAAIISQ